ncbi:MFS transporter [Roseibium denhamense]|uniref:Sugar phosphate permease n=1 Tax=Roseibium denhamense TaxID=76305 RepID=A0ABY1NUE4_9HYPH|nr:MFS transporter [Roseibium denhamense]MTI05457.1 MFS transporter [Roseibium denhamense]SMP18577.1 Sugar phosphate permease [Roseibium denhamense]
MTYLGFLRDNARWLSASYLLAVFSGFGQTFFIALSAGDIRAEFGLSHGELGLIYMVATLASAFSLSYVGKSLDYFPVRRIAVIVISSLALSCLLMATTAAVWMVGLAFFGLRLCGQGMLTHTSITAAGRWFSAQRGRAVSVAMLGFPTAEALFPILFVLLSGYVGWRGAWTVSAGVLLLLCLPILAVLLAKDRIASASETASAKPEGRQWTRAEVLRDPVFWLVSAGINAPACIGTAIFFHQVYLVELRGWSLELFAGAFLVMAAGVVCASLTIGPLIDRYSARHLLPFTLLPLTVACAVLATVHLPVAAFIFMGLVGVSNGFNGTLVGALWPEVYGTRYLGAIRAVAFSLMVFASAAGPGAVGWLIDNSVPFDLQVMGMGAYCLVFCFVLTGAARVYRDREQS